MFVPFYISHRDASTPHFDTALGVGVSCATELLLIVKSRNQPGFGWVGFIYAVLYNYAVSPFKPFYLGRSMKRYIPFEDRKEYYFQHVAKRSTSGTPILTYEAKLQAFSNGDGTFYLMVEKGILDTGEPMVACQAPMAATGLSMTHNDMVCRWWAEPEVDPHTIFKFMRMDATFEDHEHPLDSMKRGFVGFVPAYVNDMGTTVVLLK